MSRHAVIRWLWRWHKRIGVMVCLLILFLASTGFVLNHSSQWGWDRTPITSAWVLRSYGFKKDQQIKSLKVNQNWWTVAGTHLFLDERKLKTCDHHWLLPLNIPPWVITACGQQIFLWFEDGQLVDTLYDLPEPQLLGLVESPQHKPLLLYRDNRYQLELETFTFEPVNVDDAVVTPVPEALPKHLHQAILPQAIPEELNWERWLLDLHSGRWFGSWGVFVMDFVAFAMIGLALSGFLLYGLRRRR